MLNQNETIVRLNREILDNTMGFFQEMNKTLVAPFEKDRQGRAFPEMVEEMMKTGRKYQEEHQRLVTAYAEIYRELFASRDFTMWNAQPVDGVNLNGFEQLFQMNRQAVEQSMNLFKTATERMGHLPSMTPDTMNPEAFFKNLHSTCEQYLNQTRELSGNFENLYRRTFGFEPKDGETRQPAMDLKDFDVRKFFQMNEDVVKNMVEFSRTISENMLKISELDPTGAWKKQAEYLNQAWKSFSGSQETLTKNIEQFCRNFVPQNDWTKQFANLQEVGKIVNYEEMIRLNQEIVTDTIGFFMNVHQQIVPLHEGKIDGAKATAGFQKTVEDFTRMHQTNTERVIKHWESAWARLNSTSPEANVPHAETVPAGEKCAEAGEQPRKNAPKGKKK
jgi:hypothetical protein